MVDEESLARILDKARRERREIEPLVKTHGEFDLASAYRDRDPAQDQRGTIACG